MQFINILLIIFIFIAGCDSTQKLPDITSQASLSTSNEQKRSLFYDKAPALEEKGLVLFDAQMSHMGWFPKTPILRDDPKDRISQNPIMLIAAQFPAAFYENLPDSIRKELEKFPSLTPEHVDIFWVVQWSDPLGEGKDYPPDFLGKTTRLKPHPWANPDASSSGTPINRNFLIGVFDADRDIATPELPIAKMTKPSAQAPKFIYGVKRWLSCLQ
jgi:hypothetical protein